VLYNNKVMAFIRNLSSSPLLAALVLLIVNQLHFLDAAIIRGGPQADNYFLEQLRPDGSSDEYISSRNYFPEALGDDEVSLLTSGNDRRYVEERFIEEPLPDLDCPGCAERQLLEQQLSPDELKAARIELIKKQILEKLRLEHPPNVTHRPLILPEPLRAMEEEIIAQDSEHSPPPEEDFYGKTTEVIIFADTGELYYKLQALMHQCEILSIVFRFLATQDYGPNHPHVFRKEIKPAGLFTLAQTDQTSVL